LGLIMTLGAALSWACGNLVARRGGRVNMLAYVVWASLFSVPPLVLLSLWVEGPARIIAGLEQAT
jgi:O-acetylserine/cysteine efflux transporter